MEIFTEFYQILLKVPWGGVYETVKDVAIVLDVLIFVGLVYTFGKALQFRPKFVLSPAKMRRKTIHKDPTLAKRWQAILEKSKSNPPQSYTLAIIDADKFTDDALRQMGLRGEHMADRLERLSSEDLKTLDKLWRVHKIRNELVHTPDYEIKAHDVGDILATYEAFLKEIEIL